MTGAATHARVSALFLELRDLSPHEAAARLDAEPNPAIRDEVRSLLNFDVKQDGDDALPSQIGPYAVLERIGHGGSGVVLLAQQLHPVKRKVAIKIVPYAAISPDFAARFEFERRALERTDHPNIARILDAGRTADGLPYLVMEYVEGESITGYCRAKGLGLREAIALLIEVADAVQHAHQRGVIHRDLKPANVLITETSGKPTARVLDFGISKPTADASVTQAPPTSALPLGTPSYMAPEQTGGQPVDTRADVYALGAMLYELACGRPPVETGADALETLRQVREATPPAASRVRAQRPEFAGDRPGRALLADLDCIIGKAMEKEPGRRYQTVAELSLDLQRLLRNEPIEARPASLSYRAARFAQRNRGLVAAAGAVVLALMVGIGGLVGGLVEARRQRAEAINQSEAQAEINRFLNDDLLAAASPEQLGEKVSAVELLDRAARRVDQRFGERPLIAAAVHHTLGNAYMELAAYDKADEHVERALELRTRFAGADAPDTIRTEVAHGSLLIRMEKLKEGEAELVALLPRARKILGQDDTVLYSALNDLGLAEVALDKGKEGVAYIAEALEGRRRLLGERDPTVLATMSNLAQAYDRVGESQRGLEMNLAALKVAEALAEMDAEATRYTLFALYNNIGATYQDMNKNAEAAPYLRKAAALADNYIGPDNPDTLSLKANLAGLEAEVGNPEKGAELYDQVVKARTRILGADAEDTLTGRYGYWNCVWHAKRFEDSVAGFRALLPDMVRALGEKHWLTIQTRAHLALSLADSGHDEEALPLAKEAAAEFLALYGEKNARTVNAAAEVGRIERKLGGK